MQRLTAVVPRKPLPTSVTVEPTRPVVGSNEASVGAVAEGSQTAAPSKSSPAIAPFGPIARGSPGPRSAIPAPCVHAKTAAPHPTRHLAPAHDRAGVVDAERRALRAAVERAQILDPARLSPREAAVATVPEPTT